MMDTFILAFALIAGPSGAVSAFMIWREQDRAYERRLAIFQSMLRYRRMWLHADWIGAMASAPIAYRQFPKVLDAVAALSDKFGDPSWANGDSSRERVVLETDACVRAVLQGMAEVLRIELKPADLRGRPLSPVGVVTEELQDRALRDYLLQALKGQRPLRIEPMESRSHAPQAHLRAAPAHYPTAAE